MHNSCSGSIKNVIRFKIGSQQDIHSNNNIFLLLMNVNDNF